MWSTPPRIENRLFPQYFGAHTILLQKATRRNLNPQTQVEHPTLPSGLLAAWGLEKALRTAMWSLKQVLAINCFQIGLAALGLEGQPGAAMWSPRSMLKTYCFQKSLARMEVGSKSRVVLWSPEQVLNT